jgi:Galactose oxidase, central domain
LTKIGIFRQTLQLISRTKVKPPAEDIPGSIAPTVSSIEPGTSRTDGRAPPVTDSLMEPSLAALISSPHRYALRSVAGTVISYATSHTPSDMPLYTRTETRSIPSLPEPRANIRASAVITERPGGIDEVIKPLPRPRPRKPYPWSSHRLILEPPVIPDAGVKTSVEPTTSLSPSPFPRRCHALLATGTETGDLFIFGGLVDKTARNDLYRFSTRDLSATLLHTRGETPSPRVGHVSALASGVLIVWGGDTNMFPKSKPTEKHDNDLHLLDVGVYLNFSCASFIERW